MALQLIVGGSGTGKSFHAYDQIIREAACHPDVLYYIVVPEQFTMQTQRTVVEMSPGKGILNIDVLSFDRLAYHILEEVGGDTLQMLNDTGKSMVLRKLAQDHARELPYLGSQLRRPGCLDEVKSLISEFLQYEIGENELSDMVEQARDRELLALKLKDVSVLYQAFRQYLRGTYMTSEEVMDVLRKGLPFSEKMKNSVVVLDGFTGFTPIQMDVIRELLLLCRDVRVTITMDGKENLYTRSKPYQLFAMSRRTVRALLELNPQEVKNVVLSHNPRTRFAQTPELQFLEQHLFRYKKAVWDKECHAIQLFAQGSPREELETVAQRIARLVRTKGMHYGEIAVITGNLEEYGTLARQVFDAAEIPIFLDETHSVLMNPFVEFLRASVDMVNQGFSYESVFRYLRCSMSDLTEDEVDRLENYVRALGIRGRARWEETWVRLYRGFSGEELAEVNTIREKFLAEVQEFAAAFSGGRHTILEYCQALYRFVVRCQIPRKLKERERWFKRHGDPAMEREYAQIYGLVMDLLDKMVDILGEETVSRQEFLQLLEAGLAEAKVALIPPSQDQVLIGDMERTRLKDIKALFFVGVNEGNIPKQPKGGGILNEMDREFFASQGVELAPDPKELMNQQRFYLYLNLTKPSELLTLSYCHSSSKGEAKTPAGLIRTLQDMFPQMEQEGEELLPELELPDTGVGLFLQGLAGKSWEKEDPLFAELYSWYLQNEKYEPLVRHLVEVAFTRNPRDPISRSVARALYGEISPYGATRLERYAACAYAHFLQYGLRLTERAEYQFRTLDMGSLIHSALEQFAIQVHERGLSWAELTAEQRDTLIDECLDHLAADYGNTILKSTARREYTIERVRRLLRRTVWALQEQLKNGRFEPEGFELAFGGGRIDRLDVLEEDEKVYVKVIDYKTGTTSFDLLLTYNGIQMQLVVYLDGAMQIEARKHPDKEILPAGIFYYNVKDPVSNGKPDQLVMNEKDLLKELQMNGLVQADPEVAQAIDRTLVSIPAALKKDGQFDQRSSVATREQFAVLNRYVKKKIRSIQQEILDGEVGVLPYRRKKSEPCTFCPYRSVCGFDQKIPGYEYRNLKEHNADEIWKLMEEEES